MEADCFNVSILAENQFSVANVFSSKVDDKFENIEWHLGRNKVPIVTNAAGFLECEVERKIEAGDHVLLIGRVLHFGYSEQRSLGFAHGRYAVFSKHPHVA